MAILLRSDLLTLDTSYFGRPTISSKGHSTAPDVNSLDVSYYGQPIIFPAQISVAPPPPPPPPGSAPGMYANISGDWKPADDIFYKVGGSWKQITNIYYKESGVWKNVAQ